MGPSTISPRMACGGAIGSQLKLFFSWDATFRIHRSIRRSHIYQGPCLGADVTNVHGGWRVGGGARLQSPPCVVHGGLSCSSWGTPRRVLDEPRAAPQIVPSY